MKSLYLTTIGLFAVGTLLIGGCATTTDLSTVDARLSGMERRYFESEKSREQFQTRMEDFRKSQVEQDQQIRGQSAELFAAVDRLKEDIQKLNGRMEVREYNLEQQRMASGSEGDLSAQMESMEQEMNAVKERLFRIEEYLNLSAAKKPASAKPGAEAARIKPESTQEAPLSESESYARAKSLFDNGELDAAREEFQNYLKRFPKAPSADAAQFWIGEVYYKQKWYEKAILEYQKVIENYPKGNKIQAALLKQGFSFFNLGDKANGRLVLKELINKYPNSSETKIAKQKLEGP